VKFREIKSLRAKLTIYALLSMIATILIMSVAFSVFQLHWMNMGINNMAILLIFSLLIFTAFFLLVSYDTILYLKTMIIGIERMKNGDMTVELPVEGEDELAIIANSINEMRLRIAGEAMTKRIAEQTKDDLITNVAHDLRTPLTSIIGYLDLVKREDILTPQQKDKYIGIVYDKAKSLENLIEDLFDYTRYEKDKFKIECSEFDLNQFMIQVVDEFYPSLTEKQLVCVQDFYPEELKVCCDGELLARAVGNLLNNAIKYGADGKQIEVYTRKKDKKALIQVINYGRIIPKEDLEKVFEKFFRVEGSRSLKTGGTGLGLAIAKSIIDLHGGRCIARNSENGVIFGFLL